MKITLLRHGRPQMREWPPIAPREMWQSIDTYDRSSIDSTINSRFSLKAG